MIFTTAEALLHYFFMGFIFLKPGNINDGHLFSEPFRTFAEPLGLAAAVSTLLQNHS
jgi:hypothetical protein